MGVVAIPHHDPWKVSRRAFMQLMDRTLAMAGSEHERDAILQAIAVEAVLLDMLPKPLAASLAHRLARAAIDLRQELNARDAALEDPDGWLASKLAELSMILEGEYIKSSD